MARKGILRQKAGEQRSVQRTDSPLKRSPSVPIFHAFGPFAPAARAVLLTSGAVAWTLLLARIIGLRAFSKATAFGFAATIATGSLIAQAGTRAEWSEYFQAMAAIGAIFLIQYVLALARMRSKTFADVIDNTPVLLMEDGRFLRNAMAKTRVTEATLMEKIRMSDASSLEGVQAVVLETTGDIAVLTTGSFDERFLQGVRRI